MLEGEPQAAMEAIHGKIWQKVISRSELETYKAQYSVISKKLVGGKPMIHVFSEYDPANGFQPVEAELEDVYFSQVMGGLSERRESVLVENKHAFR